MILLIDNYDSFTYNLVDYVARSGVMADVIRNDSDLNDGFLGKYSGIIISPGPDTPEKSGNLMKWIPMFIKSLPVLGICLGHQAIGQYFGGELMKAGRPMHGKISMVIHKEDPIFRDIPSSFEAVQYNSLILHSAGDLKTIAYSKDEIMAVSHPDFPVWGVQFHPEAAKTKFGLKIISNWIEYNNIA